MFNLRLAILAAIASLLCASTLRCRAQTVAPTAVPTAQPSAASPTPAAPSEDNAKPHKKLKIPEIGAQLASTTFLNSKTRAQFGSRIVDLSPGIGNPTPSLKGRWSPDLSLTTFSQGETVGTNKLYMLGLGAKFERAYVTPGRLREIEAHRAARAAAKAAGQTVEFHHAPPPFLPYYGFTIGGTYAKVEVPAQNIDGYGAGVDGSLLAGVEYGGKYFLEARLYGTTPVKGYNFSATTVELGMRF